MSLPSWPSILPLPTESFVGTVAENAIRTQMDSGSIRQRQRFTAQLYSLDVSWELNEQQLATFLSFHQYDLGFGSNWFTISLPGEGAGITTQTARFILGQFTQTYQPPSNWSITAKLDIQTRNIAHL